jgi:hypothetical protein
VHGGQVAGDEGALAAVGLAAPDPGVAGELEHLDRRQVQVAARWQDVGAVQPARRLVGDHGGLRHDEGQRDRAAQQVVAHGRVDVHAAQHVPELALADQPPQHVGTHAGRAGLGGGEGAVGREP